MQKRLIMGGLLLSCVFLTACNKAPHATPADDEKTTQQVQSRALINDVSGVWTDGTTVWTIVVDGGQLQFLLDEEPKLAKIGDVDTENKTVNILINRSDTGKEAIWTIKRVETDNSAFHLTVITHDGQSHDLSFIRKIGTDDKNRIHNIFLEAEQQQREAKQQALDEENVQNEELAEEQATVAENQANAAAQLAATQEQSDTEAGMQAGTTFTSSEPEQVVTDGQAVSQ